MTTSFYDTSTQAQGHDLIEPPAKSSLCEDWQEEGHGPLHTLSLLKSFQATGGNGPDSLLDIQY